ncbi:phage neck terminator protein [Enterobacter asburiae]
MAISMLSRFALESLQAPIAGALGVSDVRLADTGERIPGTQFITLREISATEIGPPGRSQISEDEEEIRQHVELMVSVQAFGSGAMHALRALAAWLGSTPGMQALTASGTSCPHYTLPRNISEGVPGGWEERAVMNITLAHDDCYIVPLSIIQTVPVSIATAEGQIHFNIER